MKTPPKVSFKKIGNWEVTTVEIHLEPGVSLVIRAKVSRKAIARQVRQSVSGVGYEVLDCSRGLGASVGRLSRAKGLGLVARKAKSKRLGILNNLVSSKIASRSKRPSRAKRYFNKAAKRANSLSLSRAERSRFDSRAKSVYNQIMKGR